MYAMHAPEVIHQQSKAKARTLYAFGGKVSIATALKDGLGVDMRPMPGKPYEGHTLAQTLGVWAFSRTRTRTRTGRPLRPSWNRAVLG